MRGVLVVDKPQGPTSHDVVAAARRALFGRAPRRAAERREQRIGHTGTLDPLATGVLPLACGRATRLVRFLIGSDKDYDATILFGLSTDTCDITGTEIARTDRRPDANAVAQAVESLTGRSLQTPPAYSAKKVAGERAYDLARRDEKVELTPVEVTVTRATLTAFDGDRASISLTCSAGFYVRSFAQSLGERVGTGACLQTLRRTRSGQFTLDDAVPLAELIETPEAAAQRMVPLDRLLNTLPAVRLSQDERIRISHGRSLERLNHGVDAPDGAEDGSGRQPWVRLLDGDGHLVALATPGNEPGSLHPAIVLI
jgi:tRNA pseudouridine55 synthase